MEKNQKDYTKYEKARIIGSRALQISMGAPFLIKLNEEDLKSINYNPINIARLEFDEGVIPIDIKIPDPKTRYSKEEKEPEK
ncbi:MAG: DNA-directed RNA polymerase subunit K [Nanoarchaeota archaeon]|nr:DNA-directed RNA polymerase subunit K [Nanoarchaeota archaeon]